MSKNLLNIPGTKLSSQNAQLLVSTGIPSLDDILGGGLPVGTVALIEEDLHGRYSKILHKYFISEGIVSKHSVIVASQDINPHVIVKELPAVLQSDPEPINLPADDKMTIAFRYQHLTTNEKQHSTQFGHYYDLSEAMPQEDIENADITYWNGKDVGEAPNTFSNPAYHDLLQTIKNKMKDGKFFLKDKPEKRSILRISLHSLGSPFWLPDGHGLFGGQQNRDLDMFVFCLRALIRSAFAVALISIPTHLYDENSLNRCIHASDIAVRLQAFHGTDLEKNRSLSDYHGFFHLTKLAAINSLASKHPGSVEYAFKLKRKKFVIELLHLPPDIQESNTEKSNKRPQVGCGSQNKDLDF